MATPAKLVSDLSVLLRGIRSHEGLIEARAGQARTKTVGRDLQRRADREHTAADEIAGALRDLGFPATRLVPAWVPSPTSVVAAVGSLTQPLGEALVAEATLVRMLGDRARVAHHLAEAVEARPAVAATVDVIALYDSYADWLITTASVLVVDEDAADLVPSVSQRAAGHLKDVVGVPARVVKQLLPTG